MPLAGRDQFDLSGRHLKSVPKETWRKRSLQTLNLFRDELKRFSADIAQLKELPVLIVANIPEVLRTLRSLHKLDLRWNTLRRLAFWLKQLTGRGCRVLL